MIDILAQQNTTTCHWFLTYYAICPAIFANNITVLGAVRLEILVANKAGETFFVQNKIVSRKWDRQKAAGRDALVASVTLEAVGMEKHSIFPDTG